MELGIPDMVVLAVILICIIASVVYMRRHRTKVFGCGYGCADCASCSGQGGYADSTSCSGQGKCADCAGRRAEK